MEEVLKGLLGEAVSDEVITQLNEAIANAATTQVAKEKAALLEAHTAEITSLKESAQAFADAEVERVKAEHAAEVASLNEAAEAKLADEIQKVTVKLNESNNPNNELLITTLQESISKLNEEHALAVQELRVQADAYTDYVKQSLMESASGYVTQYAAEYDALHATELKKLEDHNKIVGLFENFRAVLNAHGFEAEDNLQVASLQEQVEKLSTENEALKELKSEFTALNEKLELDVRKAEFLYDSVDSMSKSEIDTVVSIMESLKPRSIEEYSVVFNTLKEKRLPVVQKVDDLQVTRINENKQEQVDVNTKKEQNWA